MGPASPGDPGERLPVAGRIPDPESNHPGPSLTSAGDAQLLGRDDSSYERQQGGFVYEVSLNADS